MKQPPQTAKPFLPYGRQVIEEDDIQAVGEVLRGDYLTTGPAVGRFEAAFAKTVNAKHAVVCANGTAALYMAARALGLGPGTKVIVPSVTFLATASAPYLNGADIVFADVDPDSGLMRPQHLADAIARAGRADAVFNVHLNGQCGAVEEIAQLARRNGLKIVDDACHALGAATVAKDGSHSLIGENVFCDLSVFSFHPVKAIAMGEGGAVTTNDPQTAAQLMRTRNHGMTRDAAEFANRQDAFESEGHPNPWYYELAEPGFNWRANDIQCALGQSQLAKLDRFLTRRRALAAAYDAHLAPYAPRLRPIARHRTCLPAWHLYAVLIDFASFGITRAAFMRRLAEEGIGSQVHYFPVHRQRFYAERYGAAKLPGADAYYARVLSLPFFASMTQDDVARVAHAVRKILAL
ncbi:MAG: UDP-4-amino-4,6-dideoxy-N-acetyl-beta-L-altrosamine transaminase [Alphaproteobacteria bacterium]|nr:UDP-4-amino-4,6-dideoxy-N-acetyl-beta-L-altrosamine transaminase [Alphaproteobacteria bacterium]MDE2109526.1 UDP-4-amino-4,6-dideoxy-N-acetyl-beta-L-altrosamine transaminase [Alphaproteobacteria bacterium]MDE2495523.1 UDP-4-amino-4,6-dideoxy-N-acetyl-beta-L-altrosamine transaminase [Alphaproteobacteria bacterium]